MNSSNTTSRETMKAKTKEINYLKTHEYFEGAILGLLILPVLRVILPCSHAFISATCLVVVVSMAGIYFIYKPIGTLNIMEDDLASVAHVMAKFKKQISHWERYVVPALLIPWIAWAIYEFAWKGSVSWVAILAGIYGAVIGGIKNFKVYHKAVNAAQEIIDDIEKNYQQPSDYPPISSNSSQRNSFSSSKSLISCKRLPISCSFW